MLKNIAFMLILIGSSVAIANTTFSNDGTLYWVEPESSSVIVYERYDAFTQLVTILNNVELSKIVETKDNCSISDCESLIYVDTANNCKVKININGSWSELLSESDRLDFMQLKQNNIIRIKNSESISMNLLKRIINNKPLCTKK